MVATTARMAKVKAPDIKRKKKWKRIIKRTIALLLVLLVIAVAWMIIWQNIQAEITVTYDSYTASVGTISNSMSFSGSFALIDSKTYTASSAATVRNVYVSEGGKVAEGDKLMRLSTGETLTADFAGTVNTLSVEEGDTVESGGELLQLADFEHLTVSIRVDEYDISSVSVGQACTVTVTALETSFSSAIEHINYISASAGSVAYYTATATVEVTEGVYPGMQVTVTIPEEEATDVVVLNMNALSFDSSNNAYVYMMDASGNLYEQYVTVGINNGNYVEITSGLTSGATVYVEAETTETSSASGILSLFGGGGQNVQFSGGGTGGGGRSGSFDTSSMPSFDMSSMPSGGGGGMGGGMPGQ